VPSLKQDIPDISSTLNLLDYPSCTHTSDDFGVISCIGSTRKFDGVLPTIKPVYAPSPHIWSLFCYLLCSGNSKTDQILLRANKGRNSEGIKTFIAGESLKMRIQRLSEPLEPPKTVLSSPPDRKIDGNASKAD
jgi:hypothetical protein